MSDEHVGVPGNVVPLVKQELSARQIVRPVVKLGHPSIEDDVVHY